MLFYFALIVSYLNLVVCLILFVNFKQKCVSLKVKHNTTAVKIGVRILYTLL